MNKEAAAKAVIGLTYDDAITFFKSIKTGPKEYYLRPIKINNMVLLKDKQIDDNRCNVVIEGGIIKGIDGWF
jgi:hypothetical protein